jgi:hypothetical protein
LFPNQAIINRAINKAIEVTRAESDVSTGITKLSGSRPRLKVKIETPKDNKTIITTEITFATHMIKRKLTTFEKRNTLLIAKEIKAKRVKIRKEGNQAAKMFFA